MYSRDTRVVWCVVENGSDKPQPRYSTRHEDVMSHVHAIHGVVGANTRGVIAYVLKEMAGLEVGEASSDTVFRAVVLKGELINDELATEFAGVKGKMLGFDKTSTYFDRNFKEIHLEGESPDSTRFTKLWKYVELDYSIEPFDALVQALEDIQTRQRRLNATHAILRDRGNGDGQCCRWQGDT